MGQERQEAILAQKWGQQTLEPDLGLHLGSPTY